MLIKTKLYTWISLAYVLDTQFNHSLILAVNVSYSKDNFSIQRKCSLFIPLEQLNSLMIYVISFASSIEPHLLNMRTKQMMSFHLQEW